jgi:hypothetical protein
VPSSLAANERVRALPAPVGPAACRHVAFRRAPGRRGRGHDQVSASRQYRGTASLYNLGSEATLGEGCPGEVRAFAEAVAGPAAWHPAPIYCLDVALTPSGPRVVEVGEVNSSDLYRCDLRAVAGAMAAVAGREWRRQGPGDGG